jgi:hypothetical protein
MEVELILQSNNNEEDELIVQVQGSEQDVGEASSALAGRFKLVVCNTRPRGGSKE